MSSLTKSSESVARVLHTLVGNFNNLGFQDIGASLVELETNSRLDSAQKEDFRNYVKNLHKLADVIAKSREEIQSAGQVGAETKEEMANLVKQFQELQRSLVRNAVPLETSELAAEEAVTDADLDFSIPGSDEDMDLELEVVGQDVQDAGTSMAPVGEAVDPDSDDGVIDETEGDGVSDALAGSDIPEDLQSLRSDEIDREEDGSVGQAAPPVSSVDETVDDEIDEELREIFIEESGVMLGRINALLGDWRQDGVDEEILGGIRREFHTLKGSAAATGFNQISSLSHNVESLIESKTVELSEDDSGLLNLLEETHDGLAAELGLIPAVGPGHLQSLNNMVALLLEGGDASDLGGFDEDHLDTAGILDEIELVEDLNETLEILGDAEESEGVELDEFEEQGITAETVAEKETDPDAGHDDAGQDFSPQFAESAIEGQEDAVHESAPDSAGEVQSLLSDQHGASAEPDLVQLDGESDAGDGDEAQNFPPEGEQQDIRESDSELLKQAGEESTASDLVTDANNQLESEESLVGQPDAHDAEDRDHKSLENESGIEPETESAASIDTDVEGLESSEPAGHSETSDLAAAVALGAAQFQPTPDAPAPRSSTAADPGAARLRIDNRKLSDLLNYSGELGLTRTQLKNIVDGTRNDLDELRESMKTIRDGLRDLEFEADAQMRSLPEAQERSVEDEDFDPLQLDRYSRLQARARDVNTQLDALSRIERELSERAADLGGTLLQQLHLGEQLQDGLISARMVAISEYFPRLRQLIRETSRRAGKPMDFLGSGGEIEVDRQVMDSMIPPFEHMIRNSVIHGMEDPEVRSQSGKDPRGRIQLNVVQQGSELVIDFMDDGFGLDVEKLGQIAIERGMIEHLDALTPELMLQIITEPGFSTAEEVSMESGRGVGMDVVLQAVRALGGSMGVTSNPGQGTTFQFRLPVTMTISQALLVRVGTYRFAILTRTIDRVMRVRPEEILEVDGNRFLQVGEESYPVVSLADRIGETSMSTAESYISMVVVRIADRTVVFEVDQFEETLEIVTKTAGSQLTSIPGVTGVTVLADTSIALVINPGELAGQTPDLPLISEEAQTQPSAPRGEAPAAPDFDVATVLNTVLVVDDSLVVRKVMQRDLDGIGLQVLTAVDGQDALAVLEESPADIALVDLEMPRMNGYELLTRIRSDERFTSMPVIIITSRAGEMHRQRALTLGADEYITKPYDINNLEALMKSLVVQLAVKH